MISDPVSHATHCLDQISGFPQLLSESPYMNIYSSRFSVKIIAPHMAQDLVSGHDQSFVLHQIFQKFKFLSGQLFHLTLIADFVTGHIDTKALAVQLPLLALPCAAPKDRFDPGYKFHHPEAW